jgi:hypothetical protein
MFGALFGVLVVLVLVMVPAWIGAYMIWGDLHEKD